MLALTGKELQVDDGYIPPTESNEAGGSSGKVSTEGDACRKCNTPVVKKPTKKKEVKPGQAYYYEFYLFCPGCKTMYLMEEAKRLVDKPGDTLF